ncbi:MAG TPA: hypothetical protein VJ252_06960, partial [Chthoniobacterales bacterium]|nr:hypothetical protein [Chthoniobacterales bacterium]
HLIGILSRVMLTSGYHVPILHFFANGMEEAEKSIGFRMAFAAIPMLSVGALQGCLITQP